MPISFFSLLVVIALGASVVHGSANRQPLPAPEEIVALPPDGGPHWNRLVFERSPYLLQHAANPVEWYPWGEEAFALAARENKPVFLSIGYSTCHWCHVMEHESFEDEDVAALLNASFVSVKLDREERPDVDQLYMAAAQAMGQRGGWPLTVVMSPDKRPFFIGTYFPKVGRGNRPGMMELLPQIADAWRADPDRLLQLADQALAAVGSRSAGERGLHGRVASLDTAFRQLKSRFDAQCGGFGTAPKFPIPHNLRFLLRYWSRTDSTAALAMVEKTLEEMRRGGIWDHVGHGFHRYSTDRDWLVPHFEKMLYDQALLAMAYVEAHQITGRPAFESTARAIFAYILRDMTSPEGAFYSAEDADSEGEEGKFYLWQPEEIVAILGKEAGALFCRVYDVTEAGNFRDPHSGKKANIPHLDAPLGLTAREIGLPESELRARLERSRQALFDAREERIHPLKDDKVLTDWNGLMIAALAKGAVAFGEPTYAKAAQSAADFVLERMRDDRGRLLKRYRAGEAGLVATLEDYAFFLWGLVELYEAVFDVRYLEEAIAISDDLLEHFRDETGGAFFLGADDGEPLPVRTKESYDGAIPSGNSVASLALLRLARMTGLTRFETEADDVFETYGAALTQNPGVHTQMLEALHFSVGPSFEVVISGDPDASDTRQMLRALQRPFLPTKIVLLRRPGEAERLAGVAAYTQSQEPIGGQATAYVCRDFACREPTTSLHEMLASIGPEGPDGSP